MSADTIDVSISTNLDEFQNVNSCKRKNEQSNSDCKEEVRRKIRRIRTWKERRPAAIRRENKLRPYLDCRSPSVSKRNEDTNELISKYEEKYINYLPNKKMELDVEEKCGGKNRTMDRIRRLLTFFDSTVQVYEKEMSENMKKIREQSEVIKELGIKAAINESVSQRDSELHSADSQSNEENTSMLKEEIKLLRAKVTESEEKLQSVEETIEAVQYSPHSAIGRRMMAKCRVLQRENDEMENKMKKILRDHNEHMKFVLSAKDFTIKRLTAEIEKKNKLIRDYSFESEGLVQSLCKMEKICKDRENSWLQLNSWYMFVDEQRATMASILEQIPSNVISNYIPDWPCEKVVNGDLDTSNSKNDLQVISESDGEIFSDSQSTSSQGNQHNPKYYGNEVSKTLNKMWNTLTCQPEIAVDREGDQKWIRNLFGASVSLVSYCGAPDWKT